MEHDSTEFGRFIGDDDTPPMTARDLLVAVALVTGPWLTTLIPACAA